MNAARHIAITVAYLGLGALGFGFGALCFTLARAFATP